MTHFIEKCQYCNATIAQCRCPAINKEVQWGTCYSCKKVKEQAEKDARNSTYDNPYVDAWDFSLYAYLYEITTEEMVAQ